MPESPRRMGTGWVSLIYGAVAHIPSIYPMLPTLPYSALPRVFIPVNNLQAPVKFTVNALAASYL